MAPLLNHPLLYVWLLLAGAFVSAGLIDKRPPEQQQERASEGQQASETNKAERVPSTIAKGAQPEKEQLGPEQGSSDRSKEQKGLLDFTLTDALIALFTAILTCVAVWQAYYTKHTMEATKLASEALVSAERAHLFVRVFGDSVQQRIVSASFSDASMDEGHLSTRLSVAYVIKNLGKSPATIKEINHQLVPLVDLPPTPIYSEPRPIADDDRVLAGGASAQPITCYAEDVLFVRQAKAIASGECSMWLIGRIFYEDVITGRAHTEPFLYRYAGNGFWPDYREAYNQRT